MLSNALPKDINNTSHSNNNAQRDKAANANQVAAAVASSGAGGADAKEKLPKLFIAKEYKKYILQRNEAEGKVMNSIPHYLKESEEDEK